ncbi:beta-galactosidase [Alteromonas sp. ASW11-36]|uniref:Beta-galactosidase n=1 Tax=Alteromonas arenosi TaxID=3055817 RepID=A0ABT7SSV8_9ALTE|nr:beta-galactosidase [Alteromonas sp. ASW11-36]MDM7859235.1 beta-galactosidase [Alteromonas sp. ASW11-36]
MLGVCYYPEHWPESLWQQDAQEMRELGLSYVRLAEFAWSKMEPADGQYDFAWLDKAIQTLAAQGLKIILCTPTATPPKWLVDKYPDILPVDIHTGTTRGFGSRRHYDFSSENYYRESMRITRVMAERYADHPAVVGWQTDNEIACHDTTHSGSENARLAFQRWLENEYGDIDRLNKAWGTIFWSMEYQNFSQIDLPILTVTEAQPSHQLAYRRFSSDQVIRYHNDMIEILRELCPSHFITHNFIPMVDTQTDNFALAEKLDFACYDNYPLGRTDLFYADAGPEQFRRYMRTGHPDFSTASFDHIRGISKGNFWIMEQQPGPVNWGHHNPRPLPGMVRFWSWEAVAHGAETVCYFRWRQAAFAQEQMHAGIKRVDNSKSIAWQEVEQFRDELTATGFDLTAKVNTRVAIIMTTTNQWVTEIERQGDSYNHQQVEFEYYSALRQLGIDVDFVAIDGDFSHYSLIVSPCLPIVDDAFIQRCKDSDAHFVFGPRSGSKTHDLTFAPKLAPGLLQELISVQVASVETLRADIHEPLTLDGEVFNSNRWREELINIEGARTLATYADNTPAIVANDKVTYVATLTDMALLKTLFKSLAERLQIDVLDLPEDVRIARRGEFTLVFNYSSETRTVPAPVSAKWIMGSGDVSPYDVSIYR